MSPYFDESRAIAVGASVLLVFATLAGCAAVGPGPQNTPTSAETEEPLSGEELIQQNLANRPEIGSPEYDERVTNRFRIPYIPGQDPEDVVLKLNTSVRDYLQMGYEDAPLPGADVTQWQVDTNKSLNDLAIELDLSYFDLGFRKAVFGPAADGEFADRIVTNYAPYRVDDIAFILVDALEPSADAVSFVPGISSASEGRIVGSSTATFGRSEPLGLPYELVASDDNGNGVLDEGDSWYWAGTGQ